MRRTLPAIVATAALLGLISLPASAAPAGKPRVHDFSVPGVSGVHAWGSYAKSGGKVPDTARLTVLASSVGHDGASRVGTLKRIY